MEIWPSAQGAGLLDLFRDVLVIILRGGQDHHPNSS